jgi:hypothetical protein
MANNVEGNKISSEHDLSLELAALEAEINNMERLTAEKEANKEEKYAQLKTEVVQMVTGNREQFKKSLGKKDGEKTFQRDEYDNRKMHQHSISEAPAHREELAALERQYEAYKKNTEAEFTNRSEKLEQQEQTLAKLEERVKNDPDSSEKLATLKSQLEGLKQKLQEDKDKFKVVDEMNSDKRQHSRYSDEYLQRSQVLRKSADQYKEYYGDEVGFSVKAVLNAHKEYKGEDLSEFEKRLTEEAPQAVREAEEKEKAENSIEGIKEKLEQDKIVVAQIRLEMNSLLTGFKAEHEQYKENLLQQKSKIDSLIKDIDSKYNVWGFDKRKKEKAMEAKDSQEALRDMKTNTHNFLERQRSLAVSFYYFHKDASSSRDNPKKWQEKPLRFIPSIGKSDLWSIQKHFPEKGEEFEKQLQEIEKEKEQLMGEIENLPQVVQKNNDEFKREAYEIILPETKRQEYVKHLTDLGLSDYQLR